jgi:predicted SprT family Zn-dependent metalloprotease
VISPHALDGERDRAFAAVGGALPIDAWPDIPVRWNRRLRRAGRAVIERRGGGVRAAIELSPAYFEVYPDDLAGILVHEAVHVGLALLSRPFGHGAAFRRACLSAGGRLHSRPMPGRVWRYRCPTCGETLERRRRPSGDRWCAPCISAATDDGRPTFTRESALVLVGLRFSAGDVTETSDRAVTASGDDVADVHDRRVGSAASLREDRPPPCPR